MLRNDIYLGAAYDAMRMLNYRTEQYYINIKPKAGYKSIVCGPAFTTYGEVVSKDCDYEALDRIRLEMYRPEKFADKPVILLQSNDSYCAHSGDITSTIYQKLGAVGFITDGNVRDVDLIDKIEFPIWCVDENPIDAINYWALTEYGKPIQIRGVTIHPGDYIIASRDGIIRVPKDILPDFEKMLKEVLRKEDKARTTIHNANALGLYEVLNQFVKSRGRW